MNIISVKQLRENFGALKAELEAGESFLLMYRSQPLAELKPVKQTTLASSKKKIQRKLRQIRKIAGGLHLGKDLTPEKINELNDQIYDQLLP